MASNMALYSKKKRRIDNEPCLCELSCKRLCQIDVNRIDFEGRHCIQYKKKFELKKNVSLNFDFYLPRASRQLKVSLESSVRFRCCVTAKNRNGVIFYQSGTSNDVRGSHKCILLYLSESNKHWEDLWRNEPNRISFYFEASEDKGSCENEVNCRSRRKHMRHLMEYFKDVPDLESVQMVLLVVGDQKEPVNKSILCACSPVFAAMFQTSMKEKESNSIVIEDLKFSIVQKLISFMYTARVKNVDVQDLQELYYAGNKYQMPDLLKECSNMLLTKLSDRNWVDILFLAIKYDDKYFKSRVFTAIRMKIKSILETDAWRQLLDSHPQLALEVFKFPFDEYIIGPNAEERSKNTPGASREPKVIEKSVLNRYSEFPRGNQNEHISNNNESEEDNDDGSDQETKDPQNDDFTSEKFEEDLEELEVPNHAFSGDNDIDNDIFPTLSDFLQGP